MPIHALKGIDPVETVDLSKNGMADTAAMVMLACLEHNTSLRRLSLRHQNISGVEGAEESKLSATGAARLEIGATTVGEAGCEKTVFAKSSGWRGKVAVFMHNPAVARRLAELLPAALLEELDLLGTQLTEAEAMLIVNSVGPPMRSLCGAVVVTETTECNLSHRHCRNIISGAPKGHVDLGLPSLEPADAVFLSFDLRRATHLTKVSLDGQKLSLSAFRHLAQLLSTMPALAELSLSGSQFNPPGKAHSSAAEEAAGALAGMQALCDLITRLQGQLRTLRLESCLLCGCPEANKLSKDESAVDTSLFRLLCETLARAECTLTSLNVGRQRLCNWPEAKEEASLCAQGYELLVNALRSNSRLTSLDISWTGLGLECMPSLMEALGCNAGLVEVNLSGNTIFIHSAQSVPKQPQERCRAFHQLARIEPGGETGAVGLRYTWGLRAARRQCSQPTQYSDGAGPFRQLPTQRGVRGRACNAQAMHRA